jgi:CheY-like chemotaxis protein
MEQAKIVIVDDDQDIRDTLKHILEGRQYTVITAANKDEGLEKIRAEKPDLAVLDVMMETWQDGFELARTLKKDPDLKHIPILMLTGVRDQTGIDFKSTAGDPTWLPVDGFLEKPAEPNTLLAEVERLLTEKTPDNPGT